MRTPQAKLTVTISEALIERLENAVYWTARGDDLPRERARLVQRALLGEIHRLEMEHGEPFPRRQP